MRKAKAPIVSAIAVLVILLLGGCAGGQYQEQSQPLAPAEQPLSGWNLSPRHNDAGRVAIEVQPLTLGDDEGIWEFGVALNTHSVDLSYDLTEVAELRCERGEEYQPSSWEGSPPGGHHRRGVLRFTALDHPTSFIEIVIRDVANVPERLFRWETGQQMGQ